jgi:hypothetical protein
MKQELDYLGHVINKDGIRVNPNKVRALAEMDLPRNVSALRSFLGLANYFRKFVKGFSTIAAPLTAQTGKGHVLEWTPECTKAWQALKDVLTSAPVLAIPDPDQTYEVETDGSIDGIGACLLQNGKPCAYISRKLNSAERNYTTTEQELLAVVYALKEWRCYLEGAVHPFVVKTDHNALTALPTQQELSRRLARWSEYLQRFHFTWEYRTGKTNAVADALSRYPIPSGKQGPLMLMAALAPLALQPAKRIQQDLAVRAENNYQLYTPWRNQIRAGYMVDPAFKPPVALETTCRKFGLAQADGYFWKGNLLVVPDVGSLRRDVFDAFHDPVMAGHFGGAKTSQSLSRYYWWPSHTRQIQKWTTECASCQQNKAHNKKPAGLLQPLHIPDKLWDEISMDWITHLPMTAGHEGVPNSGYNSILVVVERLSKMAHFIPTRSDCTAEETAQLVFDNVWCKHGMSLGIVSDRDPKFTGRFWTRLQELWPMKALMSSAYHPQTDGLTERTNRTLQEYLRHYVNVDMNDWDKFLAPAEFAYNNATQESTGYSPFYLNTGRHPRVPEGFIHIPRGDHRPEAVTPSVEAWVGKLDELLDRAKRLLQAAQRRQKAYADKSRREVVYLAGDKVLLSTQNLRLSDPSAKKLLPKYIGPFVIQERIGEVAYRLKLPSVMKHHPVFHVSLLADWREGGNYRPPPWHMLAADGSAEVESILSHRTGTRGSQPVNDYLIAWAGAPKEDATWVPESRVPHRLIADYWQTQLPLAVSDTAMDSPMLRSLRRSRRHLGLAAGSERLVVLQPQASENTEDWSVFLAFIQSAESFVSPAVVPPDPRNAWRALPVDSLFGPLLEEFHG